MLDKFTRFKYMLHVRKIFKYKDTNGLNIKGWERMLTVTKRILVGGLEGVNGKEKKESNVILSTIKI